jgi:hypothetical protein
MLTLGSAGRYVLQQWSFTNDIRYDRWRSILNSFPGIADVWEKDGCVLEKEMIRTSLMHLEKRKKTNIIKDDVVPHLQEPWKKDQVCDSMYQLVHRRCACSVLPTIICWGQL